MSTYIWRLDGATANANQEQWQAGLLRHLRYQPVTSVCAADAGRQRRYLSLVGCAACHAAGCDRTCTRALLLQLLRVVVPGLALVPVPQLRSAPASWRRVVVVPASRRPGSLAAALAASAAVQCASTWSTQRAGRAYTLVAGACVSVPADTPSLAPALRAAGWKIDALASARLQLLRRSPAATTLAVQAHAPLDDDALVLCDELLALPSAPPAEVANDVAVAGAAMAATPDPAGAEPDALALEHGRD